MGAITEFIRAFNLPLFCLTFLMIYTAFTPGDVKLRGNQCTNLCENTPKDNGNCSVL